MSTDEYTPSDGDVRWQYVVKRMHDGATRTHAEQEYRRWLAAHDARVRRDAAREAGQYVEHLHPERTAKEAVRADIDIAADRMGRGLYANGRKRETP